MAQLSPRAKKTLIRLCDLMLPENGDFPAFSATGSIAHLDKLTDHAPESDISDLSLLLSILSFMPDFILKWLIHKMETAPQSDGALSTIFRQLDFGIRGLLYSCYYSGRMGENYTGKNPLDVIGYEIKRVE